MIIGQGRHDRRHGRRPRTAVWAIGLLLTCSACSALRPYPAGNVAFVPDPAGDASVQGPVPRPDARQERQLQVFGPILLNPSPEIDDATRRGAAEELVMMRVPEARAKLDEALRSEHPPCVLAVVGALEQASDPLPDLVEAVIAALRHPPEGTTDRLALLLPRYGETGVALATAVAMDQSLPAAERAGPLQALGSFRNPEAAGRLVELLNPARGESPEVIASTCRALERLTGFPYGADPAAWRDWWADVQDLPREQWLSRFVESLSGQLTKLQQETDRERRSREQAERRIVEVYRDLFPVQPVDQQIQRLPALLADELDVVRRFAVGRIDRLLRDGVRVPTELQDRLADRLDDASADIRRDAARILDQCGYDKLAPRLADALTRESDPENLRAYLGILTLRPHLAALGPGRDRLADPEIGDAAAAMLWEVLSAATPAEEELRATRVALRDAFVSRHSPAVARVLGRIGNDEDVEYLLPMLDGDVADLRRAVADGFLQRGLRQPLLDRADDEVIYPFTVRAIATGPADLTTLQTLAALAPPAAHQEEWRTGVRTLTARLPRGDVLPADTVLASVRHADAALRRDILADALARATDAENGWRQQMVRRLAPLQVETGAAAAALDTINLLNGAQASIPELVDLRFRAAALAGRYEVAAGIHSDARRWVDLFQQTVPRDVDAAKALRDEIVRRFGDQLRGDLKQLFDAAAAGLSNGAAAGGPITESASAGGAEGGS